jgi:lipoate-protein ligase B
LAVSQRGGGATYHGPGQLVVYPVVRLDHGVLKHVTALAQAALALAAAEGVTARFRRDCPGVWVGRKKLAAVGVHVHRRVAIHGLAINVTTSLAPFDYIVPCGQAGGAVTSLEAETGRSFDLGALAPRVAAAFADAAGFALPTGNRSLLSQSAPVE